LTDVELYQFVSQFAAMIIKISKLHHKVDQQRKELDEMTGILFRQNAHLSSLYHVELDLMKVTDPVQICRIVVDAVVNDLEARRAAAFLVDETSQELIGVYASGGFEGIDTLRLPIDREKPIRHAYRSGRVATCLDYPEEFAWEKPP
jgi:nitrate/nitrite-specific signal transduction histidine kinase